MMKRALVRFFVPGRALPKGSPSILRNSRTGKPFVREKKEAIVWQAAVKMLAEVAARKQNLSALIDTAVAMEIHFVMPRKKSAPKNASCVELAAVKPDIDKVERAILDALQGVIYTQDSRVTWVLKSMRVHPHERPEETGVHILVGLDSE